MKGYFGNTLIDKNYHQKALKTSLIKAAHSDHSPTQRCVLSEEKLPPRNKKGHSLHQTIRSNERFKM